jgi:diaminopimelate decarboxylase
VPPSLPSRYAARHSLPATAGLPAASPFGLRKTDLTLASLGFHRRSGELFCEGVALREIAHNVGTPAYVYSRGQLLAGYRALAAAGPDLICFSVKALSNLSVLALLHGEGSGFDVVSLGELARVMQATGDVSRTVFSGVGKTELEMASALELSLLCYNVESEAELTTLSRLAQALGTVAPISLRVNPDVDPKTHPYIATAMRQNKFGIPIGRARAVYAEAASLPGVRVVGIDCHLGSQITTLAPFRTAVARVRDLCQALLADGHPLTHVDLGGGLGVRYHDEKPPSAAGWVAAMRQGLRGLPLALYVEPGRSIAADAGVLLTEVVFRKRGAEREFAVVDAGMNDLLRPALYGAYHDIEVVDRPSRSRQKIDVVGPVCESSDSFAQQRMLPRLKQGDLLALRNAGAYGFSMSSTYNSRPRPAEVLVDGGAFTIIREREHLQDLWRGEVGALAEIDRSAPPAASEGVQSPWRQAKPAKPPRKKPGKR